jgi:Ca-activated chloride channel homolog
VPPHAAGVDVALEKLVVPPLVAAGAVFPVRVVVRNPPPARPAVLGFAVDGEATGDVRLVLQPGVNAVEVPYRMTGAGGHRLRVEVSVAGDTLPGNDYREAPVTVGGKPRLLLVSARPHPAPAAALAAKGISVTAVPPDRFPERLNALLGYQCVVFEDVTARSVSPRALDTLERYVRDFGGGFIAAAGARTFGDAGFKRTPLARLLPVTIEPHRPPHAQREPLALFILIDRSNSMGYSIRNRLQRSDTESKLAYAKRAALAVVAQLHDTDLVGLIVFDSEPFEVAPLRSLKENRPLLTTDIPRLQPGGGTDFYDALDSARKQLIASGATTKHVMLLTDGDTNRGAADHYPLIAELAKAGISVTTIRIGDDAVNLKLLTDISGRTGGQFHHVERLETLPALLLRDTSEAMARGAGTDEHFVTRIAGASQVLRGLTSQALPAVDDYAYTRLKPGADLLLSVQSRRVPDPLLGVWRYGLGRVAAFTASPDGDAAGWVRWDGFAKLWSQLVRWTMRDETAWDYALAVRRAAGQTTLHVQTFDDLDGGVFMARLFPDPDHPVGVALVPRGPRLFTGRLPSLPGGHYPLMLIKRDPDHAVHERTELISVPGQDEEPQEEFETRRPNLPLLHALTAGTGGALNAEASAVADRQAGSRQARRSLDWLFIPAAMGLLLVDIGVRRLAVPI